MVPAIRPRRHTASYAEYSDSQEASSRPTRNRNRPDYTVDNSSDDTDTSSEIPVTEFRVLQPSRATAHQMHTRSAWRNASPSRSKAFETSKRRKVLGAPRRKCLDSSKEDAAIAPVIRARSRVSAWQTLEHDILTSILTHAAYPLYHDHSRPNASIRWLVQLSYLSKSFRDAAMSALFYSPPMYPYGSRLLDLLRRDQDTLMSTNYRMKPRKLVVEARHVLVKKPNRISLPELVSLLPLLESVRIVSYFDDLPMIWAHPSAAKKTYIYENQLFEALEQFCPRLKEFEWNARFAAGIADLIKTAMYAHERLRGLTSITLMNLYMPDKASEGQQEMLRQRLVLALNELRDLKDLKITQCTVFGDFAILASIQTTQLRDLTITDCPSLTSPGLEIFLRTKGSQLEYLRVRGCQFCDGAFLARLPQLCGRLRTLQVDLTFSDVTSWHDTEPHFDNFLPAGPIRFPSTLVDLEINNLRRIDASQLEASLESLVGNYLPDLRRLSLKAILAISDYRVRARIRKEWRDKLEYVFLRHSNPPMTSSEHSTELSVGRSHSTSGSSGNSMSEETKKRQSRRLLRASPPAAQSIISEDAPSNLAPAGRQGLCDFVEFRVDDQRPADSQYGEGDFVDDERSGDEDYTD